MGRRRELSRLGTAATAAVALELGACSDSALMQHDEGSPEDALSPIDVRRGTVDRATVRDSGPTCGNGQLEGAEQCDDGNTVNGDGCSLICRFELETAIDNRDPMAIPTAASLPAKAAVFFLFPDLAWPRAARPICRGSSWPSPRKARIRTA
jgi:cysteine-rich repeat protein